MRERAALWLRVEPREVWWEPAARNMMSAESFVGRLVDVACNGWAWGGLCVACGPTPPNGSLESVNVVQERVRVAVSVRGTNIWYRTGVNMINAGA